MSAEEILSSLDDLMVSGGPPNLKGANSDSRHIVEQISDVILEQYNNTESELICMALVKAYYRGASWRLFVLQLIPAVVGRYLAAVSKGERKQCTHLEAFMLSIYNSEIMRNDGSRKVEKVRLPSLVTPSIYHHDPMLLVSGGGLTESALSRFNAKEVGVVQIGPFPSWYSMNAENRFAIVTFLLKLYNSYLNIVDPSTLATLCKMCSRLCRSGFHFPETDLVQRVVRSEQGKDVFRHVSDYADFPRVPLHPVFMLEMLQGAYFAMFNGRTLLGVQALDDVAQRASFELYSDVLLATNAIANSLLENPSGSPGEGPMGIRPVTSEETLVGHQEGQGKRHLIKNASLRIKKLADDIPMKAAADSSSTSVSSSVESPVTVRTALSPPSINVNRPKLLPTLPEGGKGTNQIKVSRSEMSMQALLQKRVQAEASAAYIRDPAKLAEEDNFEITSSEEPTPRRDMIQKGYVPTARTEMNVTMENGGHTNGYQTAVETDV